ncbi:unnamed protein product [Allacma fusca]|uniref:Peptidase S1 domain-containing protein n=1 Tax=Allacma fusca TaxID=39272 RepID=A0A8J2J556_9HEXA|nr:unnamed protein product [Allacma fusca]
MKQSTFFILVLSPVLLVQIALGLPTQTNTFLETSGTTLPQSDDTTDDGTTPISFARQEEVGPTGPPGPPEIDEESDEDEEEEVTERVTTFRPVLTRKKVATSDFGHVKPDPEFGTNERERPIGTKIEDFENQLQEEEVQVSSGTATGTLQSSGVETQSEVDSQSVVDTQSVKDTQTVVDTQSVKDTQSEVDTQSVKDPQSVVDPQSLVDPQSVVDPQSPLNSDNLSEQQILEEAIAATTLMIPQVTSQTVTTTTTTSTSQHEWVAEIGNGSAPEVKPVLEEEKVGVQATSERSGVSDNDELQRGGVTEIFQEVSSSTTNLIENVTSSDFERDWALSTGDEILSDPQAKAGCECGRVPFKVSDAGVNQWPWTGAVVTNGIFAGGRPHCGATLINSKYVLTAAHCVDGLLPYRTQVWLTVHDNLQNSVSSSGTLKLEVEKILMHPNYNRRSNENDIALVALVEPVSIGQSYFVPACVPAGKNEYSEFVGRMAAWGSSELGPYNTRINNNKICKMDMPILSNDVCDRDTTHKGRITKTMICAGFLTPKNNADCVSDAGGGLIISNGGRHTLVGITSYGYTPNRAYSPTVHTRVSGL